MGTFYLRVVPHLNFHAHWDQTLALAVQFGAEKYKDIVFPLGVFGGVAPHMNSMAAS